MLKGSPGLQSYRGFGVPSFGSYIPSGTFYRGEKPSDYSNRMLKEKGDPLAQFIGINPEAITGKTAAKENALKLISGDLPSGSSISAAANKIVGFNRAKISPRPSNIQNLISTLTSNIFNDNSSITNIFGVNNKQERKEGQKPFSFVGGAFDRIKEAFSFITFFGSKKNLDKVRDNIKKLKIIFTETFDAAKELRKSISKIFKQLKGFDFSGGGGGGGNAVNALAGAELRGVDSGFRKKEGAVGAKKEISKAGRLTSTEKNTLSRLGDLSKAKGGGKLALAGAGLAGTGMVMNALSSPGSSNRGSVGFTSSSAQDLNIPGTVLDRFNSILDRFDKILDGLGKKQDGSSSSSSSTSSGARTQSGGSPSGGSPSSSPTSIPSSSFAPTGEITGSQTEKEKQMFSYLTSSVGLTKEQAAGILGNAMRESGYRTNAPEGGFQGMFQWDASRWARLNAWAKKSGLNPMDTGTQLQYGLVEAQERGSLDRIKKAKTYEEVAKIWYDEVEVAAYRGKGYAGSPHAQLNEQYARDILRRQQGIGGTFTPQAPSAQALSQPTRQTQQSAGAPVVLNVNGGQQQAVPTGGNIISSPPPAKNGPDVPFLSPKNPDNFLVFYSRLTYNIIDG